MVLVGWLRVRYKQSGQAHMYVRLISITCLLASTALTYSIHYLQPTY